MEIGAMIIPGSGHVLVAGPFAMVMAGNAGDAQAADLAFADLAGRRAWTFESVATALQDLVVERSLGGVAALLTVGADPVVFLFDDAISIFDGSTHRGTGRDEWVTEVVLEGDVELRLASQPTMPPQHGTVLRDGVVPGAGMVLESVKAKPEPVARSLPSQPPEPAASNQGGGRLAQFGHQPPPPVGVVPPPPHEASGQAAPRRVQHNAPPPPPE